MYTNYVLLGTFNYFISYQVSTYIQVLWEDVNQNKKELMNGAVESIHTLCGIVPLFNYLNFNIIY